MNSTQTLPGIVQGIIEQVQGVIDHLRAACATETSFFKELVQVLDSLSGLKQALEAQSPVEAPGSPGTVSAQIAALVKQLKSGVLDSSALRSLEQLSTNVGDIDVKLERIANTGDLIATSLGDINNTIANAVEVFIQWKRK